MIINGRSNRVGIVKRPFKVLITLATLWSFLFNMVSYDFAWAARTPLEPTAVGSNRAGGPDSPGVIKALNIDTFSLPEYLGHIKDSCKGNGSGKVVIHIQDAHCNYAAQHKISEIIEYLNKEYGIDTINLEGGAKDYDLSTFTRIYNKDIRERTADYFVKEGLVNGAEYFAINNPDKATLWGIEDTKLYLDNLNVYRDSLKHKDEVDKNLNTLTHILGNLKTKIYSQELLDLDDKYSQYKAGTLEFKDYLAYLIQIAKQKAIDIKAFTNVYLLSQTLGEEDKIDFKKANNQRDDLIDKLQKKLSKKSLEELVLKTVEFRSEKILQKDFYAYLTKKANLVGIELNDLPDLQKYIVYISMYNAIDKMKIMEEMDALENNIKGTLYQNDKQKELNKLSKNLAILKNIFNISLTKEDYKYYTDNEDAFNASNYITFIDKEAPLYKITAQLDKDITGLDKYRDNIAKFYEYSFKRDGIFLKNIKFGRAQKIAVVVTGGFHTENLCEIFKKQNIAYISIMPTFSNYDGYSCPYFNLLAGKESSLLQKLQPILASTSSIQIASMLSNAIAPEVWGRANIDAFRAAVLVQEQVAKGRNIVNITQEGDNVVFHFENGDAERMPIRALLDAVHQKDIDGQMERLSEDSFEDIDNIDKVLDEIREFLRSMGASQEVLDRVEALKGKNADGRAFVRLVRGVTFRGHAGGQGIRINADLKGNEQEIKAIIIHEIIAGLFGDHFLAERGEQAFRASHADTSLLARAPPLSMPIWNMTPERRLLVDRDFATTQDDALARELVDMIRKLPYHISVSDIDKAIESIRNTWAMPIHAENNPAFAYVEIRNVMNDLLAKRLSRREFVLFGANKSINLLSQVKQIMQGQKTKANIKAGDTIVSNSGTRREVLSIDDLSRNIRVRRIDTSGNTSIENIGIDNVLSAIERGIAKIETATNVGMLNTVLGGLNLPKGQDDIGPWQNPAGYNDLEPWPSPKDSPEGKFRKDHDIPWWIPLIEIAPGVFVVPGWAKQDLARYRYRQANDIPWWVPLEEIAPGVYAVPNWAKEDVEEWRYRRDHNIPWGVAIIRLPNGSLGVDPLDNALVADYRYRLDHNIPWGVGLERLPDGSFKVNPSDKELLEDYRYRQAHNIPWWIGLIRMSDGKLEIDPIYKRALEEFRFRQKNGLPWWVPLMLLPNGKLAVDANWKRQIEKTEKVSNAAQQIIDRMTPQDIESFLEDEKPTAASFYFRPAMYLTVEGRPGEVIPVDKEFGLNSAEIEAAIQHARYLAQLRYMEEQQFFSELLGPITSETDVKDIGARFAELLKARQYNVGVIYRAYRAAIKRLSLVKKLSSYISDLKDNPQNKRLKDTLKQILDNMGSLTPDRIKKLEEIIQIIEQHDILDMQQRTPQVEEALRNALYGLDILDLELLYSPIPEVDRKIRSAIGNPREFDKMINGMEIVEAIRLVNGQILFRARFGTSNFIEFLVDGEIVVFRRSWNESMKSKVEYYLMPDAFREKVLQKANSYLADNASSVKERKDLYVRGLLIKNDQGYRYLEKYLAQNPLFRYIFLHTQEYFGAVEIANVWRMENFGQSGGYAGMYDPSNKYLAGGVGREDVAPHEYVHFLFDILRLHEDKEIFDYFMANHPDFLKALNESDEYKGLLDKYPTQAINEALAYYLATILLMKVKVSGVGVNYTVTYKDIEFLVKKGFLPQWMVGLIDQGMPMEAYYGKVKKYIEEHPGALGEADILQNKLNERIQYIQRVLSSQDFKNIANRQEMLQKLSLIKSQLVSADLNSMKKFINEIEDIWSRVKESAASEIAKRLESDVNLAAANARKVSHNRVNNFIKDNLPQNLKDNPKSITNYRQVNGYGVRARVIPIRGLLKATGQFAHIGLGQVYGEPVIYVDADYQNNTIVLNHELYEISKWEAKRLELGRAPPQMRQWILDNYEEARQLAEKWHKEAPSIEPLINSIRESYISDNYVVHGTNAYALAGILKAGGKVLSGKAIRANGVIPLSGESGGLTPLNNEVVSGMRLGGTAPHIAITYARRASGLVRAVVGGGERICPANIDFVISAKERFIEKNKDAMGFANLIAVERQRLEELKKIKEVFDNLTSEEKDFINLTTGIPIVVCGTGERLPAPYTPGGIGGGEVIAREINVIIIATTPEHIPYVENMLKNAGRNDIRVIDINLLKSTSSLTNLIDVNVNMLKKEELESVYPEERDVNLAAAPSLGINAMDILSWIGEDLWKEFIALNKGDSLEVVNVQGNFEQTLSDLNKRLADIPDDKFVCVLIHNEYPDRTDHRIVIDRAGHIKDRAGRLWMGDVKLMEYEFLLDFSSYPSLNVIHLHDVSLGREFADSLQGKGLMSKSFENIVGILQRYYPGWEISTVAVSDVTKHWLEKYFNGQFVSDEKLDKVRSYVYVDLPDLSKVMIGRISSGGSDKFSAIINKLVTDKKIESLALRQQATIVYNKVATDAEKIAAEIPVNELNILLEKSKAAESEYLQSGNTWPSEIDPFGVYKYELAIAIKESTTETPEIRQVTTVEVLSTLTEGRDNDVKVVVGVPMVMNRADVQPTISAINRGLAKNGFGRMEDNKQVITFEIDVTDPVKTAQNQEKAMQKATEGLSPNGRVVLFAPQMERGPQLAGKTQEQYKGQGNITVVPDAYSDSVPEKEMYPDVMVRVALGRNIAFYYSGKDPEGALAVINNLLAKVAAGFAPITTINELLNLLKPLRIRPIIYKEITDWQRAQKATATSL